MEYPKVSYADTTIIKKCFGEYYGEYLNKRIFKKQNEQEIKANERKAKA